MAMLASAAALGLALPAAAQPDQTPPKAHASEKSFADAVKDLEPLKGLLPVYLDRRNGKVLLALTPDKDGDCGQFLYQVYMRAGLGSTPVGVDRSNPSETQLIAFKRAGRRIVAELQNNRFRAGDGKPDEVQAVRESFPPSTVWSGEIVAEESDGALLVDISSFLTRDAFGVIQALKDDKQGAYKLAADLSYPDVAGVQAFPENLEFEAHETFVSDDPGAEMRGIAPDPHSVTAIEHHSLIKLPPPGFVPREADQRTGAFSELVADYGTPLDASTTVRLAHRFRLEKTDPTAARSTVKKPIVFYVDRAAPEPVRTALVEGARWWAQAFDAAGFIDAFKVEVLPEGVSPLDARYNVINWVHRQTRGWSYGANIIDPRTGEIVKGSVLLGSLRVRQDRMIFEGLVGADKTDTGAQDDPIRISIARLHQLAVHETGHAIGLEHNFAGSTFDDRASVMDYPPPRVKIVNGELDFTDAYQVGVGTWDKFAIKWLYTPVAPGEAGRRQLDAIVHEGYAHGLRYVSDNDSRPTGAAHPYGSLWDDGPDAVEGLKHVLAVRRIALDRFGVRNLPKDAPVSDLRRVIVPIYLFHRYEVDAASKLVGGIDFTYAVRGDAHEASRIVPGAEQRRALDALLATLDPSMLDLPDPLIDLLSQGRDSPRDKAFDIEVFGHPHAPGFDLGTAADAAVDITLGDLLDPDRLNRVADQGG
ncbi:MAG: zinc-dependent metalloprotease, partial [Caulobacteraceae bacterium]